MTSGIVCWSSGGESKLDSHGYFNRPHFTFRDDSDSARTFFLCDGRELVSHRLRFLAEDEDFGFAWENLHRIGGKWHNLHSIGMKVREVIAYDDCRAGFTNFATQTAREGHPPDLTSTHLSHLLPELRSIRRLRLHELRQLTFRYTLRPTRR